ncbi:Ppx/GppA phosphatase family protein [Roseococcus pinisoli]|uniref:Ppx/GppA family phosphatase n=1 Tax=Roseococcus pinisoli TaxID=2835040 RepID=A0ABS5QGX0_9PROT|nr:Ppx/GppA phosphatase family protein [Roseococcus pinisoli]MBS7812195.1 Ppx/GppA family phosphatase [Roseococcus pinisoli]
MTALHPSHAANGPPSALFAALDLGTNNCRLLIGAPTRHGFRVVDSFSRIVRLGEGLAGSGALSDAAMDRTISALSACAERLHRRPVRRLAAVATEACRRAANGNSFLARAAEETGLRPRIISPREEAELAMESCAPLLEPGDRRAILFDIGGGSTEIAWIRTGPRPELIGYLSIPCGVVTLAEREGGNCFSVEGFQAVVDDIHARLRSFDRLHCIGQEIRRGGVRLIGTSGTVTTLAGVVMALPKYRRELVDGTHLGIGAAEDAMAQLFAMGRAGLSAHPCIGPERADFVLPGCAVYSAIHRLWPVDALTVADRGLREGMLLRLMRGDRSVWRA